MKVEIWSDFMCPFCYIGKRHFEKALETLSFKNEIDVEWEKLLEAHFVRSLNNGENAVLLQLAEEMGLDTAETQEVLQRDKFAEAVRYDIYESRNLGIRGVPYFVTDRKYGVFGAQPVQAFTDALTQSFTEWKSSQPKTNITLLNKNDDAICNENGCKV